MKPSDYPWKAIEDGRKLPLRPAWKISQTVLTDIEAEVAGLLAERAKKIASLDNNDYLMEVAKIDVRIAMASANLVGRRDSIGPKCTLRGAQAAVTQYETRIAELNADRVRKIEGGGEVDKIDTEIAILSATLAVHRERVEALQRIVREVEQSGLNPLVDAVGDLGPAA